MIKIEKDFSYGILAIVAIVAIVAFFNFSSTKVVETVEGEEPTSLVGEAFKGKGKCDESELITFINKGVMTKEKLTSFANENKCKGIIEGIKKKERGSMPTCNFEMGDVNEDGEINEDDILDLVDVILNGGYLNEAPCGDMNADDSINVGDIVNLVNILNTIPGCTDPEATNYNPDATIDDGSCEYLSILLFDDFEEEIECSSQNQCMVTCPPFITLNWENTGVFEWRTNKGMTPSTATGPAVDNTLGTSEGIYLFVESSPAHICGVEPFILESSEFSADFVNLDLIFAYHMYGHNMGTLSVDVYENEEWIEDVWSKSGAQQVNSEDDWGNAVVDLIPYSGMIKVRFRGVVSNGGYRSDMAIDDILITGTTNS